MGKTSSQYLFENIKNLLLEARNSVVHQVNITMTKTYFLIGYLIINDQQKGEERAEYGKQTLKNLSLQLNKEFGKGFSVQNLERMRLFYLTYSKSSTVSRIFNENMLIQKTAISSTINLEHFVLPKNSQLFSLSWSHYVFLISLSEKERNFYETESINNNWSLRELKRQFDSALYERIILSRDKKGVLEDNIKKYHSPQNPQDIVKDPYILEFLGLDESKKYSETNLEQSIIDTIEKFLLELGKGFSFIGRQQRFTFDEEHFFVDLVFYNRLLKCFVLIDLKIGKLKHQDLGQMQMYVNYYDRFVKTEDESKTIGIILCKGKNSSLVEITLPEENNIFASKYELYLPSKDELKAQMDNIDLS